MSTTDQIAKAAAAGGAPESSSTAVHRMRITSGGSIQAYVAFALKHLENNPQTPLVLHTIPSPPSDPPAATKTKQVDGQAGAAAEAEGSKSRLKPLTTIHPCTLTTPRLISVVELIKRDYLVGLAASGKGKGKHRATGLWQYTETGLLSDSVTPVDTSTEQDDEVTRAESLKRVLEGKTKPKMTHRPFLQITLSTRPLGLESQKNVTCQYVLARRRRKGREETQQAVAVMTGDVDLGRVEGQPVEKSKAENSASERNMAQGKKRKAVQGEEHLSKVKRKRKEKRPQAENAK